MWAKLISRGLVRRCHIRQLSNSVCRLNRWNEGPELRDFLIAGKNLPKPGTTIGALCETTGATATYLDEQDFNGHNRKVHIEVYGCQMNVSDTEIVWSILQKNGYTKATSVQDADVVLLVTCAIREGAETKVWNRLHHISVIKSKRSKRKPPMQLGILGCMAERLKTQVLEVQRSVDIVCGPDAYKDLPRLLALTRDGKNSAVNVLLSLEETYADTMPVRLNENSVTAYVSIQRGCDNMCTYCIVPFTRGRERSRPITSIEHEAEMLAEQGVKEITLLGQNVNSYRDVTEAGDFASAQPLVPGFKTVYKTKEGGARFAELIARVAEAVPNVRIRFTSPHPKDFPSEVLNTIKYYPNICNNLHIPAQSGSSTVLERMRRGYTREAYLELINHIRDVLPNVNLSSDFICGFCGETDAEFEDTITLMEAVKYNVAFLFSYSMREKTTAHRRFQDDVPAEIKKQRLIRMSETFRQHATELNKQMIGNEELILVEGKSKKSDDQYYGRTDGNIKVIIPANASVPDTTRGFETQNRVVQPGDFVSVQITQANSQTLKGTPMSITTIRDFYGYQRRHPKFYNDFDDHMAVTI